MLGRSGLSFCIIDMGWARMTRPSDGMIICKDGSEYRPAGDSPFMLYADPIFG